MKKQNDILAPLGCYEKDFVKEILKAYRKGLSIEQIAVYMDITPNEVDHVLDLYLPIEEAMGSLSYEAEDEES